MAKAKTSIIRTDGEASNDPSNEEDRGLLSRNSTDDDEDIIVHASSPATEPPTPRTPNRVRFDLPPAADDDLPRYNSPPLSGRRYPPQHSIPLLTDIEAPSITLAASPWGNDDDVDSWAERERSRPKSGLRSAFMNMANSIIGAGIIGQPYAFRQAGLLTGIILLIVLTITVDWTIRLIVINRDRRAVIVIFILGISWPLSLYRDIAKLAKASTLALISMMVILFTVITQGFMVPSESRGEFSTPLLTINNGFFQAIGVISFAFVCHHNSLLIYGSLKTPTIDRFALVTHYSTSISMVACLLMALSGFLTFGSLTLGNVLNNFPADNIMVNIARLCFGLNMLTTLPLEAFVCREVMFNYWFPAEPFNMNLHLIFSTSLVVSAMTLSLLTCDLGAVFELIGATSACALAYILPPLCYLKLSSRSWKTVPAMLCVGFGTAVMGISLVQAVQKIISNEGGTLQCH
ncbi:hypothetical protein B7494_g4769 [Chlorociboria aeruginascens]|nr:hypothetical protein B7494_g4769 [Chlorociboria aeruginascens]